MGTAWPEPASERCTAARLGCKTARNDARLVMFFWGVRSEGMGEREEYERYTYIIIELGNGQRCRILL